MKPGKENLDTLIEMFDNFSSNSPGLLQKKKFFLNTFSLELPNIFKVYIFPVS